MVIPAEIAVPVIDKAGSIIVSTICRMAGFKQVRAKHLEFTAKERKDLEEPARQALASMDIKMSPLAQLGLMLAAIYSVKAMEIISAAKPEKVEDIAERNELNSQVRRTARGKETTRRPRSDAGKKRA